MCFSEISPNTGLEHSRQFKATFVGIKPDFHKLTSVKGMGRACPLKKEFNKNFGKLGISQTSE